MLPEHEFLQRFVDMLRAGHPADGKDGAAVYSQLQVSVGAGERRQE